MEVTFEALATETNELWFDFQLPSWILIQLLITDLATNYSSVTNYCFAY